MPRLALGEAMGAFPPRPERPPDYRTLLAHCGLPARVPQRLGTFGDAHAQQLSLNHQTSFTDCLPSSFGDNLGLWLKTSAGPHDGQIKKGEASNGVNVPLCGPYSVLMTPALKILSDA